MTRLPAASIAPSAVTTDASEARHPTDLRVNQLRLRVYPPVNLWHVLIATGVVYILLTAALVILP